MQLCMAIYDFSYRIPYSLLTLLFKTFYKSSYDKMFARMLCNVVLLPCLSSHTAEQLKGKKKAEEFMLLIPLSEHKAECSACLCTGVTRKCWYEELVRKKGS